VGRGLVGDLAGGYRAAEGWSVEVVRLSRTPDRHDGEWIRIRYCGFYVRDTRGIVELERHVSLAGLKDALAA
jgi:hypothetical protein